MAHKVKEWLKIANVQPTKENAELYMKLVKEEFEELCEAHVLGDFTGMVDGAIDLKWVIDGLLHCLQVDIDKAEQEVARSNFSKFEDDRAIAAGSAIGYMNSGTEAYVDEVEHDGKTVYLVRRLSDNKILKPATYVAPDWGFLIPPEWL